MFPSIVARDAARKRLAAFAGRCRFRIGPVRARPKQRYRRAGEAAREKAAALKLRRARVDVHLTRVGPLPVTPTGARPA